MNSLIEILQPSFLLRDALYGSVIIGLVAPLVGVYCVLRRMVFLGVALPQVSAAGIALAFLLSALILQPHDHGQTSERLLALGGSIGCTLATLIVLAALDGRGAPVAEGRIGAVFAFASAVTILFLAFDPQGEAEMVNILKGDILAATRGSLTMNAAILVAIAVVITVFRKQLLLVSFDRDLASVFGMRTRLWDLLLYLVIGITISVGVMSAGPVVIFGFLVIPPLTARLFCRHMVTFSIAASVVGGFTAFLGFWGAYTFDMPLGPAEVALGAIFLGAASAIAAVRRRVTARR